MPCDYPDFCRYNINFSESAVAKNVITFGASLEVKICIDKGTREKTIALPIRSVDPLW